MGVGLEFGGSGSSGMLEAFRYFFGIRGLCGFFVMRNSGVPGFWYGQISRDVLIGSSL